MDSGGLNPALRALLPLITGPLKKGDRLGSIGIFDVIALNAGATTTTHNLGRVPNGFIQTAVQSTAALGWYVTVAQRATWTATQATITGSAAGQLEGFWV